MSAEAKPAWLEDWYATGSPTETIICFVGADDEGHDSDVVAETVAEPQGQARARLCAAAPALVRAVLLVEWGACDSQYTEEPACPECAGVGKHETGCAVDAALTLAGFHDAASRDAAHAELTREARERALAGVQEAP